MIEFILNELGNFVLLAVIFIPLWWKSNRPLSKKKLPMAYWNK